MTATAKASALETFVPLMPPASARRPAAFAALNLSGLPQPAADSSKPVPATTAALPAPCSKPTVTLQRNGDLVTGIRVQCACGQVVDLSCVY